jgi:peptide/nickel transport system ATP-binding protein
MVTYGGRMMEPAARRAARAPLHPYTRLLPTAPAADPTIARRQLMQPALPPASSNDAWSGCPFAARCPHAEARCKAIPPPLRPMADGRQVACHRADEWLAGLPPAAAL